MARVVWYCALLMPGRAKGRPDGLYLDSLAER
ncbi:MAG: hypothetical protein KatS3mg110_3671 [Pirellulaceae bacterium]|nr:MAG: hypothetical protein KatS3mg110_3671 [Pirellulaceae bacterium]